MVCEDTLQIKNFPPELSDAEKEEFLLHFGATNVRIITSKTKRNSVSYAKFKSKETARNVMCSLHQIRVLNHYLCVKYAEHTGVGESLSELKGTTSAVLGTTSTDDENKKHYKSFVNRMHAFNRWVGFNQPTPSHLKYSYPGPNRATINNIAHALASVPKFYTQVLHLMNRMNFPPPFANEAPPPMLSQPPPPVHAHAALQQPPLPPKLEVSDEESEMESDPDSPERPKEIIPILKRPHSQMPIAPKIVKRHKLTIQPIADMKIVQNIEMAQKQQRALSTDAIFERVGAIQPATKRIELKLTTESLHKITNQPEVQIKQESPDVKTFDLQLTTDSLDKMAQAMEAKMEEEEEEVARAEIEQERTEVLQRLTPDELAAIPIFKNYQPGAPTSKLYIKNISREVDTPRLEQLYRQFNVEAEDGARIDAEPIFEVRLMQEGRMKGQAFITMGSVAAAERALLATNGLMLDDKPLVVVFGKVPPLTAAAKKMIITPEQTDLT